MILAAAGVVGASIGAPPGDPWAYYVEAVIGNAGGPVRSDWPVAVELSSGFNFGACKDDGSDLLFRSADGLTVLPSWVESFDADAESAVLWVKVPAIPADDSTSVRLYYGNEAATVPSDVDGVFLFGEDFRDTATAAANVGAGSVGEGVGAPLLCNTDLYDVVAIHGGSGWRSNAVREQSNIVWTGTEFVILVTGMDASIDCDSGLYYADSIDGPWTEYTSNPVLPLAEDCYITVTTGGDLYLDGSDWAYVTFERKSAGQVQSQNDIGIARTKNFRTDWEVWNGSAWTTTVANHAAVLVRGSAGQWDDTFTGSPIVVHDGTQFVCIYEGSGASLDTGVARSADGITWTKEASNPILTLDVGDDIQLIDGTWWMTGHGGGGSQYRYFTTDAPADWDSSSFTMSPLNGLYETNGNSINLAFGFDGCERWATYQDGIGTNGIQLFNWIGGDKWQAARFSGTANMTNNAVVRPSGVGATGLKLHGASNTVQMIQGIYTAETIGVASNFAIRASKKQTAWGTDDQWSNTVAFGTGSPAIDGSTAYGFIGNGYLFGVLNPDEFVVIREYSSTFTSASSVAVNTVTTAEAGSFAVHECSYLSTGALAYTVNGSSKATTTDTSYLSGDKRLMVSQGNTSARRGGTSEWEWLVVRPFDGSDPSVLIGSEVAT
jgi:hypothetical protein